MSYVLNEINEHIAFLTINRPDALNAMNPDVIDELKFELQSCIDNDSVGVIILTGSGEKAFIAGADIKKMQTMDIQEALVFAKAGQALTLTIENSPKPVIAAVNGYALGGGCEISLACHMRIASDNAIFGQPEVLLGSITSTEAKEIGLVNHVVSQEELMPKCIDIAKQMLKNGPNAISESLECIRKGNGKSIEEGLEIEAERFSQLFENDESSEGLSAFVEKRPPKFRK